MASQNYRRGIFYEIEEDKIDSIAEAMAQKVFDQVEEMAPNIEVAINVYTKEDYYSKRISP